MDTKTELERMIQEFKENKSSALDRKNTSITFKCSMSLKAWIHQQASDGGFDSASAYIENALTVAGQASESNQKLNKLSKLFQDYKAEFDQLKAERTELEKAFANAYEHAKTKGIATLQNYKPKDFTDYLKAISKIVKF